METSVNCVLVITAILLGILAIVLLTHALRVWLEDGKGRKAVSAAAGALVLGFLCVGLVKHHCEDAKRGAIPSVQDALAPGTVYSSAGGRCGKQGWVALVWPAGKTGVDPVACSFSTVPPDHFLVTGGPGWHIVPLSEGEALDLQTPEVRNALEANQVYEVVGIVGKDPPIAMVRNALQGEDVVVTCRFEEVPPDTFFWTGEKAQALSLSQGD